MKSYLNNLSTEDKKNPELFLKIVDPNNPDNPYKNEYNVEYRAKILASSFNCASSDLKKNKEIVKKLVGKNWHVFKYAAQELKENEDFVLHLIALKQASGSSSYDLAQYVSDNLKSNEDFIYQAAKIDLGILGYMDHSAIKPALKLILEKVDLKNVYLKDELGLIVEDIIKYARGQDFNKVLQYYVNNEITQGELEAIIQHKDQILAVMGEQFMQ